MDIPPEMLSPQVPSGGAGTRQAGEQREDLDCMLSLKQKLLIRDRLPSATVEFMRKVLVEFPGTRLHSFRFKK